MKRLWMFLILAVMPLQVWADGMWGNSLLTTEDPNYWNGVPVCALSGAQWSSKAVSGQSGEVFVAWSDGRASGDYDIYCQKIDSEGNQLWTANGVLVCNAARIQYTAAMVEDGSGGVFIVWRDSRDAYNIFDIYAQHLDSSGALQWSGGTSGRVICDEADTRADVCVVSDGNGGLIIAWSDSRSGESDIYAQRVDASGNTLWAENGMILCDVTGTQRELAMMAGSTEGAWMVWRDDRVANADVYGIRIDNDGNTVSPWVYGGNVVCDYSYYQWRPVIVTDGGTGALVFWEDSRSGYSDIYGQRFDSNGTAQWSTNGVVFCTAAGYQSFMKAYFDTTTNSAMLVWDDGRNSDDDVYAQRVSLSGVAQWTANGVQVSGASGDQDLPDLAPDGIGGSYVFWRDGRSGDLDMYAQRISADGVLYWEDDGMVVSDAANNKYLQVIASDGEGGAVAAWEDTRTGSYDIYAQRLYKQRPVISGVDPDPAAPALGSFDFTGYSFSDDHGAVNYIKLTRSGESDIVGSAIICDDNYTMHCQFDLTGAALGEWSVVAYDSLGQTSSAASLTVATATPTVTLTPTATNSATASHTPTRSPTRTVSATASPTPTVTETSTLVVGATQTTTPTLTPVAAAPSATPSRSATATASMTPFSRTDKPVVAYPNPARDRVVFAMAPGQAQAVTIAVYNMTGERVAQLRADLDAHAGNTMVWECGDMAQGVYIARVILDGRLLETIKLAVVR